VFFLIISQLGYFDGISRQKTGFFTAERRQRPAMPEVFPGKTEISRQGEPAGKQEDRTGKGKKAEENAGKNCN
jgi:hypothetical protein